MKYRGLIRKDEAAGIRRQYHEKTFICMHNAFADARIHTDRTGEDAGVSRKI